MALPAARKKWLSQVIDAQRPQHHGRASTLNRQRRNH